MKLFRHEQPEPNIAGLKSTVQQAEMKLIVAGRWPPLKPLPVFKYETGEYRATIDFDKTRGEWVCRKTSLPSNKIQELRGGLTEIMMALPHGQAEVFTEAVAAEHLEQELEKDANRRLQAILEWRENYENGAIYSELRHYLSESQQEEIDDSIRLSLTARQLQFNPKNVEYVFDALSKAGGRPATLIDIAQRNKAEREADASTRQARFPSEPAKDFEPEPIRTSIRGPNEGVTPPFVESLVPATLENFPTELIGSVFPEQDQTSSPEPIADPASHASPIVTPEIRHVSPLSLAEDLEKKARHYSSVAGLRPQVRIDKVESVDRIEESSSHSPILEISGFQIATFAFVILIVVLSITVGLTVGRGPLGKRLRDAQNSILDAATKSPALRDRPAETTSRTSIPPPANTVAVPSLNPPALELEDATTSEEESKQSTRDSASSAKVLTTDSNLSSSVESEPSVNPSVSPERNDSTTLIARDALSATGPKLVHSPKAPGPISNPSQRRRTPVTRTSPQPPRTSTVLVTLPAKGSKPFHVIFQEKPIAASSSFAMTSQLSVLVSPVAGPSVAHRPARLEAGELVSFVWPRYPRPGDRYGSAETVKIRTTVGKLGQVQNIALVNGSVSLLPAAMSAIRLWRFKPTLLNNRPIQAQQDITIEFRPSQFVSNIKRQR